MKREAIWWVTEQNDKAMSWVGEQRTKQFGESGIERRVNLVSQAVSVEAIYLIKEQNNSIVCDLESNL